MIVTKEQKNNLVKAIEAIKKEKVLGRGVLIDRDGNYCPVGVLGRECGVSSGQMKEMSSPSYHSLLFPKLTECYGLSDDWFIELFHMSDGHPSYLRRKEVVVAHLLRIVEKMTIHD